MADINRLSQEEFDRLNQIKNDVNDIVASLGQIAYQKANLDMQEQQLKSAIVDVRKRENDLLDLIKTKYGNVTINIETGEISEG